jgi:hypothetical protein
MYVLMVVCMRLCAYVSFFFFFYDSPLRNVSSAVEEKESTICSEKESKLRKAFEENDEQNASADEGDSYTPKRRKKGLLV